MGRHRPRPRYDDCHWLHVYEDEIVMRALAEMGARERRVTVGEMVRDHPDRFKRQYLRKVLKRLHAGHRLSRYRAAGWGRKEIWAYSIRPTGVS